MQSWHQKFERALIERPRKEPLDAGECQLTDFHHSKFDDVEVPGQYMEVRLGALPLVTTRNTKLMVFTFPPIARRQQQRFR